MVSGVYGGVPVSARARTRMCVVWGSGRGMHVHPLVIRCVGKLDREHGDAGRKPNGKEE